MSLPERIQEETPRRRRIPRLRTLLLIYLVLLGASHAVRVISPYRPKIRPDQEVVVLGTIGAPESPTEVQIAVTDTRHADPSAPTVVVIHGSPVASIAMLKFSQKLAESFRVITPDLPGFGNSTPDLPDYSVRAHGEYLVRLLESLEVTDVHLIAYSMGGGVALEAVHLAPERIRSITMLSAIGVQEFELLGDYHLNHAVHGVQLGILWGFHEAFPHFGAFDGGFMGRGYARNFFDTDQRPLRGILEELTLPVLILHGEKDRLVPPDAAKEHTRIVPQSEFVWFDGGHITSLSAPPSVIDPIVQFVGEVEAGRARTRASAAPARVDAARVPFDRRSFPGATGMALIVAMLLLALATHVSEDLTCIGAGVLVARGSIGFLPATFACMAGIFLGDIALFLIGRSLGRKVVTKAPFRWMVKERDLIRAAAWLERRGVAVIFISRFMPGLRLPTYVAAGILPTRFWWFTGYFALATVLWTPPVVGISAMIGRPLLDFAQKYQDYAGWLILGELVLLVLAWKLFLPLCTYRGRRGLVARWTRLRRWEYWSIWIFYPPIVAYAVYLMFRHRSMTVFVAANPGIEHGGFIGESKIAILRGLAPVGDTVARYAVLEATDAPEVQEEQIRRFRAENQLTWPIVLKPDVGERGCGVGIMRSDEELRGYLRTHRIRTIVQEYIGGREFGVFYIRHPDEEQGRVTAITDKQVPVVIGDGERTLEKLVLADRAKLGMSKTYLSMLGERALDVPAAGERVRLVEIGTHALGGIFLEGSELNTPELEAEIDRIARAFEGGFHFGRFDVRVPDLESFQAGKGLRVIELNGVSSEPTNIYDPRYSVFHAQRVLREQWRTVYSIGAENARRGAPIPGPRAVIRRLLTTTPRPVEDLLPRSVAPAAVEEA